MIRFALSVMALLVAACAPPPTETVEGLAITAGNGFIMEPVAGRDVTMGGVDIAVSGGDVRLIGAEAAFADTIELHTMSMHDDQMRMRKVDGFEIADGETFQLERGGNHMMMFGVEDLAAGEERTVTLTFETEQGDTEIVEILAKVRALDE